MLIVLLIILPALAAGAAAALWYGAYHWNSGTQELRAGLDLARSPIRPSLVDFRELKDLPAPVQRYFRTVLRDRQPMVTGMRVRHTGTFNMSETTDQWKPFTSDQKVVTKRPGFDWDGRIAMMPGLSVRVHDAYVAGEGILHASLLGLFTLASLRDTSHIAEGELMRFLAEATWYATALLPSQGVRWKSVDDRSAYATLSDGNRSVTLLFVFNEAGLIETVQAEARSRMVSGNLVPTPWQGRFWNYGERNGMLVPLDGEVAWLLPTGTKAYWRGHITDIAHEFMH